ncbi:MAG TPA: hypothetical protein VFQ05_14930 [Candidatus Eisenbacteria bacterium]|nr:hypothetical protein [Candidatus Eisenbacteria bacterium]
MTPQTSSGPGLSRHVLRSDPGVSYLLHVPAVLSPEPRLVVSIHGASRNVDVHARLLSVYAEMHGAVLVVPYFPEATFGDYQRLGRIGRGKRADLALHRIVAEAAAFTGSLAVRIHLFGFSAGAQFAHRYAMAYPQRVAFAVIVDAGRYTMPNPAEKFPRGIGSTRKLPGLLFDPGAFLRVPMKVYVGADDSAINGSGPRRKPRPDREPRAMRAQRARHWVDAMNEAGRALHLESQIACEELPDRVRSFRSSVLRAGLAERAFEAMFGPPLVTTE